MKFGYVNTSTKAGKEILRDFTGDVKVQYTPTILMYGSDKSKPVEYYGNYSSSGEIGNYVCDYCETNGFGHKPAGKEHVPESTYETKSDDYPVEANYGFDNPVLD